MTVEEIDSTLTAASLRVSPVRRLVAGVLAGAEAPMSGLDIETALDTVDRSSITRTLAAFTSAGLVHTVDDGSGSVKYEFCRHAGHDHDIDPDLHPHFHCMKCGRTICLDDVPIPQVPLPEGYTATSANFVIKGICPDCAQ